MASRNCVVSLRLTTEQKRILDRLARRLGRRPADAGAMLLDEGLRRAEFAGIDFRDTPAGRMAYVQGTRTAVWLVAGLVRDCGGDVEQAAKHLRWPKSRVQAALNYAEAFPHEIELQISDAQEYDFHTLRRGLPQAELLPAEGQQRR